MKCPNPQLFLPPFVVRGLNICDAKGDVVVGRDTDGYLQMRGWERVKRLQISHLEREDLFYATKTYLWDLINHHRADLPKCVEVLNQKWGQE